MAELKLYGWNVCPHCHAARTYLEEHKIPFRYLEIEEQPQAVIEQVIRVNGGDDWVVPTLEFNGQWIPGKAFHAEAFAADLRRLGVIS